MRRGATASLANAYANARQYLNQASAKEIATVEKPFFPDIDANALENCIATYQQLGNWTPHVEITREAYEVTLDVFQYTGAISERIPYELVCAPPPNG